MKAKGLEEEIIHIKKQLVKAEEDKPRIASLCSELANAREEALTA